MVKAKRMYGCTECGATFPKWAGQQAQIKTLAVIVGLAALTGLLLQL